MLETPHSKQSSRRKSSNSLHFTSVLKQFATVVKPLKGKVGILQNFILGGFAPMLNPSPINNNTIFDGKGIPSIKKWSSFFS